MQRTKPTPKQRMFAKAYVKNKFNGAKSALEVYNTTKKQAGNLALQTLKKPMVQKTIQEELTAQGITMEYLNNSMYEAMETNKHGKPSQAVLADLIKHGHKMYNNVGNGSKVSIKQEYKVLLSKDQDTLKQELTTTLTRSQELLNDLE